MIKKVTVLYRQGVVLPAQPPNVRPRVYGTDDTWYPHRVKPLLDATCDPEAAPSQGWFEEAGINDLKGEFDLAARGFKSCTCTADGVGVNKCIADGSDITSHHAAKKFVSYNPSSKPSYTDGRRALHLVRRPSMHAAAAPAGSVSARRRTQRLLLSLSVLSC